MSEGNSSHKPATDPPGAVSDQNGEEAESGHRKDQTHPEPRTGGAGGHEHSEHGSSHGSIGGSSKQVPGEG
jgi:hypothetical protein